MTIKINRLARNGSQKEITPGQGILPLTIQKDREVQGIGMGVLSDGTPYLNQRGLAALCGVQNAHIGTISSQWHDVDQKPRLQAVKNILGKIGPTKHAPHIELTHKSVTHFCYPADVCLAILEYYAFDAGANVSATARDNYRKLAGSKLQDMIYQQVGYDPSGADRFHKWHERLELNYQSAPKGFFHVFNEANTIIYELIIAGAEIGEKFVVDISIGTYWSKYWEDSGLAEEYDVRRKYPHRYPDSHPQAKANPHESWCYPIAALGDFRMWLQEEYLEGGKFRNYLQGKVKKGDLPPSFAELALEVLEPPRLA
ncbi:hypothetical protein ELH03_17370 [Rhizobium beringeri]|uniref:BstA-like C-terminal domain-containing protein n=1 Tax=Rhizobium beringeri TaxID=3019934 RepID=A0ABY1XYB9_9HYPH|nr:hypothetical protein [Rhizobium beringeri]TBE72407.1 hypothetical protein ELH03_17370 [Rhizobium beringeri]